MKRFIKNNLLGFILGAIVFGSIGVYAAIKIQASEIGYKDTTVEATLNDLYSKASGGLRLCKFIDGTYGTKGNVGSKYECQLGDGETRYFYILTVSSNNTVDMIMDRNLENVSVNYNAAVNYFSTGAGTVYLSRWPNVITVGLPDARAIARDVATNSWNGSDVLCFGSGTRDYSGDPYCKPSPAYAWLFNNLNGCKSFGCDSDEIQGVNYWTKNLKANDSNQAANVYFRGMIGTSSLSNNYNIRPVITILKSSLYE